MRWARKIVGAARGCIVAAALLAWFALDHVWRRLRGRQSLSKELFGDVKLDLTPEDAAEIERELANRDLRRPRRPNGDSGGGRP